MKRIIAIMMIAVMITIGCVSCGSSTPSPTETQLERARNDATERALNQHGTSSKIVDIYHKVYSDGNLHVFTTVEYAGVGYSGDSTLPLQLVTLYEKMEYIYSAGQDYYYTSHKTIFTESLDTTGTNTNQTVTSLPNPYR